MKYIQIKSESEINLKGIKSELVFRDSLLKSVILTDIDGNTLTIDEKSTYESLGVYIPKEPEKKDVFRLTGSILNGIKVDEIFELERDAIDRRALICRAGIGNADFNIKSETVLVDDLNKLIDPESGLMNTLAPDDIPF